MSGQSGHVGSKRPREVFLTSSSLSLSSLSSSCTSSSDDAIKIITKTSYEDQKTGKLMKAYSPPGSEISCVTSHVRMEPVPSSSRPAQLMNRCVGTYYDPERIPASVFAKNGGDLNWTEVSNDSLFSLRMSTCQAFSQSNIIPEEGEFLAYSPSLLEDSEEEERSQVKEEAKSVVVTSVKTNTHQERSSTSTPLASFDQLFQGPLRKPQASPLPLAEKKNRKRKKKKKKKKDMCCLWSWLFSGVSKCCCYKWRKCCCCRSRGPKAIVL